MRLDEIARRVGVFVVIVFLVVAGGVVFAGGEQPEPADIQSLDVEAYSSETVAAVPGETGEIEMSADGSEKVVLIDASHGASIDREQLTPLVETLTQNGVDVRFLSNRGGPRPGPGGSSPFNASLQQADAFIAFGAEQAYTQSQVNGLEAFADAGGRVLIVKEPPQMQIRFLFFGPRERQQSVPMPLAPVVSQFGISFGNGYLYNMHQYDNNYRNVYATPVVDGQLTEDVDRLVLHESTPVRGPTTVVQTTERTELSETRKQDQYSVVVRSGNVTAVGDSSVFSQAYYRRGDNEVFVGNTLDFLVSGEKMPEDAPSPPEPEVPGNTTRTPPRGFPP
ncbi:MAG: DUF4350 domain-containing protein [Halobacteriales archaeon]